MLIREKEGRRKRIINTLIKLEKVFGDKVPNNELKKESRKIMNQKDYEKEIDILMKKGIIFHPDATHTMRVETYVKRG